MLIHKKLLLKLFIQSLALICSQFFSKQKLSGEGFHHYKSLKDPTQNPMFCSSPITLCNVALLNRSLGKMQNQWLMFPTRSTACVAFLKIRSSHKVCSIFCRLWQWLYTVSTHTHTNTLTACRTHWFFFCSFLLFHSTKALLVKSLSDSVTHGPQTAAWRTL